MQLLTYSICVDKYTGLKKKDKIIYLERIG